MGKTSSAVKQRYNNKVYTKVSAYLKKELVAKWEAELAKDGTAKAEFIRNAITEYLKQKGVAE